jgi:FkbM family methyltransferase
LASKLKKTAYKLLNRSGFRSVLTMSAATFSTLRLGKLCTVSYDGEWVHRFPSCTLVEPMLTLWTPEQTERQTSDVFLHRYLPKQGDTIVDVGAGTGWETLFFSRSVGASGRVISIEAHPGVFRCLSRMCAENRLDNVTLIQAAVADRDDEVQISDSLEYEKNSIMGETSGVSVSCATLDSVFQSLGLKQVDFLKMNIEGAERLALPGMGAMLPRTKNICISCHDFLADEGGSDMFRTKAEIIAFLKQNGFDISLRESDGRCNVRDYVYGRNEKLVTSQENNLSRTSSL